MDSQRTIAEVRGTSMISERLCHACCDEKRVLCARIEVERPANRDQCFLLSASFLELLGVCEVRRRVGCAQTARDCICYARGVLACARRDFCCARRDFCCACCARRDGLRRARARSHRSHR
jgi:hypothetical protein